MPKLSKEEGSPLAVIRGGSKDGECVYFDESNKNEPVLKVESLYDTISDKKVRSQKKYMSLREMMDLKVAFETGNIKEDIREIYDKLKPDVQTAKNNHIKIHDGTFDVVPYVKENQVSRIMVSGQAGQGKSTWISKYAMNYKKLFPKNRIIIISRHDEDEVLDKIKGIKRIKLSDELLNVDMDLSQMADSLCILDDIDTIADKKINKLIANLRDDMLENGRHHNIYMCCVSHMILNGRSTRHLILECDMVVFFPRSGQYQLKRFLKEYAGFDREKVDMIMKVPSRWCALNKRTFPNTLIAENDIYIL